MVQAWDREVGARDLGIRVTFGDGGEVLDQHDLGSLYINQIYNLMLLPF